MAVELDNVSAEVAAADGRLPRHVAVIMDGNGRWAQSRSKPRYAGHRAGVAPVRMAVEKAAEMGLGYLTLFAFSSENWRRPREEVSRLMGLFFDVLRKEIDELDRNNVRIRFVGQLDMLSERLLARMSAAEERTSKNSGLNLIIAVAYGGRWDITHATREIARRVEAGDLAADDIDEDLVSSSLALSGLPDPDLLIRTGGEQRISNFLLWNLAYSELYFCDCLWPDFDEREFRAALEYYAKRQRRFGQTSKQLGVA
jgi:undecaprenyl diphosphate synthase